MGASDNEKKSSPSEYPQHQVTVLPFCMSKYPVTQVQWQAIIRSLQNYHSLSVTPSNFSANDHPVEQVSWEDVTEFCMHLSRKTGRNYRLPTEAEWEYSCRAGTSTQFHFGEVLTPVLAKYQDNSESTSPVGATGWGNAFGLYDMHGNVWEWCQDHWYDNHKSAGTNGEARLKSKDNQFCVIKGGSWLEISPNCRSSCRKKVRKTTRENHILT